MSTNHIDIWPDETAVCPLCKGTISQATPLIAAEEARPRITTPVVLQAVARLNADVRPCCPHCHGFLNVLVHHNPRCQKCHRQSGADGRTLGLVNGLCSMCTPDMALIAPGRDLFTRDAVQAVRIMKRPQPVIVDAQIVRQIAQEWQESGHTSNVGQQLFLLLATAQPAEEDSAEKLMQRIRAVLQGFVHQPARDYESMAAMWRDLWMYAGWRRLYVKLDRAADKAAKTPCTACGGACGYRDHEGRCDAEPKPWRTCKQCDGDGTMAHTTDGNLILRVVRLKDNAYLRLAANGWMPS